MTSFASLPFISLLFYCDVPLSALYVRVLVYVMKATPGSEVRRKTTGGANEEENGKSSGRRWAGKERAEVALAASEL